MLTRHFNAKADICNFPYLSKVRTSVLEAILKHFVCGRAFNEFRIISKRK